MSDHMKITLNIWRQPGPSAEGQFEKHVMDDVSPHMSFLEMLDVLNQRLIQSGKDAIAFDHDCREGICGACSLMIDGRAHGPKDRTTACQLHMRSYSDGAEITVEPWRLQAFPIVKDLVVNRGAFDRIIQAGGYISVRTGSATDANQERVRKEDSDLAMDAAACIGCGACAAACPNASASLFTAAKIAHLALLPQGQTERYDRVRKMVAQMDTEGFGHCTNHNECEAACPKGISVANIAQMNRDFLKAMLSAKSDLGAAKEEEG